MELNREKLKRMFEDTKGNGGSANGGGGGGSLAGYATQAWVNEGFVSIEFFNRLFTVYGPGETSSDPDVVIEPNDLDSTIKNIKAMFGLWTEQYLSALGLNPGGTGSATSLSMLDDVNITTPVTNGQALVYNATSLKWENQTISTVTALANLTDVLLTSPSTNQVLIYDGTQWVNSSVKTVNGYSIFGTGDIPASGGGGGNYVSRAGDTMTGNLSVYANVYAYSFILETNKELKNSNGLAVIDANTNELVLGYGYGQNNKNVYIEGNSVYLRGGSGRTNIVYTTATTLQLEKPIVLSDSAAYLGSPTYGHRFNDHNSNYNNFIIRENGSTWTRNDSQIDGKLLVGTSTSDLASKARIGNGSSGWTAQIDTGKAGLFLAHYDGYGLAVNSTSSSASIYVLSLNGRCSNYKQGGYNIMTVTAAGQVGIQQSSPSYTLHVSGSIYATGAITALSDIKQKNIKEYMQLGIDEVANAPVIKFTWKDPKAEDKGLQVGSIAQYWEKVLPEAVKKDKEGTLSMSYGVVALVAAVSTAKKVQEHERRIADLERENKELKGRLRRLNRYGK